MSGKIEEKEAEEIFDFVEFLLLRLFSADTSKAAVREILDKTESMMEKIREKAGRRDFLIYQHIHQMMEGAFYHSPEKLLEFLKDKTLSSS